MGTFFVSKRTVIAVFMLAALVLRSLVPGGFMIAPAAAGDGTVEIVICTAAGPKSVQLSHDGVTHPATDEAEQQDLCPFAFTATGTLASAEPALAEAVTYANVAFRITAALFAATPQPGATSARGPPLA